MRLNEIRDINSNSEMLNEGVIPAYLTMTLEQIIRDGKATNSVHHFIMAGLIEMYKNGGPRQWPRQINSYHAATFGTNADLIEQVRAIEDNCMVELASWFMTALQTPENYEAYSCDHNHQDVVSWMNYVLRKQD